MQILFSADWHIKLGQKNVPKDWATERYSSMFAQLHELEAASDLHIIGGDLFDRVPTLEELELFWQYCAGVQCDVIIYDGNHEATKKNHTFLNHLAQTTEVFSELVKKHIRIVTEPYQVMENAAILPYTFLHRKSWGDLVGSAEVLFTHVRGEIPPHVTAEVPLEKFDTYKTVFSGDLHSHSNTQRNIVYPGSPVTTSFHRSEVDTGVVLIDSDTWDWRFHKLELPQLLRKTVSDPIDMVPTSYHHTIYEIEGDLANLSQVATTDLLDKKVVKRATEASLLLTPEMSMSQELAEYLTYVLELPDNTVKEVVTLFERYKT